MTHEELLSLNDGDYKLSDRIDNYKYRMVVSSIEDNKRLFQIFNETSSHSHITVHATVIDGYCVDISLMAVVGGLYVHSNDVNSLLYEIKLK